MRPTITSIILAAACLAVTAAQAQSTARLRGTIVAVDGDTLAVRSREGENLSLKLAEGVSIAVAKSIRFEDIRPGDYVGATTRRSADGTMVALEVHYLPPTAAPGQTPWDLEPETTMTNASVAAAVSAAAARELLLEFKGGSQRILVPEGVPLVRAVPGARTDLKPGEFVFAIVQKAADGSLIVPRIQVSQDGVKPPQ